MKQTFTFFFILFQLLLNAQTPSNETQPAVKPKLLNQADYQFGVFFNAYSPVLTDYSTLKSIAVNPAELNLPANIDSFTRRPDSQEGSQGTAMIVLSTSFSPYSKSKERVNRQHAFRVGLSFRDVNTYESSYNYSININDSTTKSRDYFVNGNQKFLGLETMYTISSDDEKPVNVYIGLGLSAGYSIASTLEVNSNLNTILKQFDGNSQTQFTPNSSIIKGKNALYTGVFIPAGVHVRVRKNLGALAEFRYGMYSTAISGGGPKYSRNSVFAGIGIRYTFGVFEDRKPIY